MLSNPLFFPRKIASSYRELEERKQRLQKLEKLYADMALQKELKVLHLYILIFSFFLGATFKGSIETTYKSHLDWVGAAANQFLELFSSVSD
jgi:hypothetical protein